MPANGRRDLIRRLKVNLGIVCRFWVFFYKQFNEKWSSSVTVYARQYKNGPFQKDLVTIIALKKIEKNLQFFIKFAQY